MVNILFDTRKFKKEKKNRKEKNSSFNKLFTVSIN